MADETAKRAGCGCLPLVGLFFLGSFGLRVFENVVDGDLPDGLVAAAFAVSVLLFLFVAAVGRRRRQEQDANDDGAPTSTRSVPTTPSPVRKEPGLALPGPGGGPDRETEQLRQRLADAVADINAEVGEFGPGGNRRVLTSEEMIARAKRRIAERGASGGNPTPPGQSSDAHRRRPGS